MILKGLLNKKFSNHIHEPIRDSIAITVLLCSLIITHFVQELCPSIFFVDTIILFEEFWIMIFVMNYSVNLLTELSINLIRNVRRIREF